MVVGIIQARTNSSRLHEKVLLPIQKKPILQYMLERISQSKKLEKIIVATSTNNADDRIANLCKKMNVDCSRGPEDDVLSRFKMASNEVNAKIIVRLNADCPLLDSLIIDNAVELFKKNDFDYVGTLFPRKGTYPYGMNVEVFSNETLDIAFSEAKKPSEREHVTPFIWKNPTRFKLKRMEYVEDLSKYRFCLDYEEDFKLIKEIIENLYVKNPNFTLKELIEWVGSKPEILKLNSKITNDEGWLKSLEKDKAAGFD